jgi:large subunit ribosomal protein L4
MELQVNSFEDGAATSKVTVCEKTFGCDYNEGLVHEVVVAYLAGGRAGTKAQKSRSEVRGGGKKPWRQKGSGRARAGTITSPIWRKGGVTFAAKPRDYDQKLNKKAYRKGLMVILSKLVELDRIKVVENLELAEVKTKLLSEKVATLSVGKRTLIVTEQLNVNIELSARNIPMLSVITADSIDPVSLVGADTVIVSQAALKKLEGKFA